MILVKNVHLYAPEDKGFCDVLIGGGDILKIAEDIPVCDAYDVKCINGNGKVMFPGLIDGHVHILGGGGEGGYHTRTPEIMLTDIISGGVTTVVGCLGTDGTTRTMTSLIAKARGLENEGISTFIYTGSYQVPVRTLTGNIMDDMILIDKVVGTGEIAISDHRSSQPSLVEFKRLVADTRVGGILSGKAGIVNIHMGDGRDQLKFLRAVLEETEIPAYNMLPTHINRNGSLMADGIDYAKNLGGYIDLTTSSDPDWLEEGELTASEGLKKALDAGVMDTHITFSSDGQGSLPVFDSHGSFLRLGVGKVDTLYREMKTAVLKYAIPLEQALKPVTLNPAVLFKMDKKGRAAAGMDADLVLADEKTMEIDSVICKGKIMIQAGQVLVKGTFER